MDKILYLDHVDQYNRLYGLETLHPLVSVINLNEATRAVGTIRFNYGVYALFLKLEKACDIKYGRQKYDYEEGTIVCFAPGQTAETTPTVGHIQTDAYGIIFHPDLLRGTSLNKTIKNYTFFSYEVNEALHVSGEEQTIILDCLKIIDCYLYRITARLLHAFLRTAVYHAQQKQPGCADPFRAVAGRVFRRIRRRAGRTPFGETLRRQIVSLIQLFRRHAEKRNRKDSAGIYSGENNRSGKGPYIRHPGYGKPDSLFPGIPISAAPVPPV